jgi:O-methyltransferase involved in polyketide biosynthesis
VVERLFRGLRHRAAADSTLALSVSRRDRVGEDAAGAARRAFMNQRMRLIGEPWRTSLSAAEWRSLLARTGWVQDRAVDPHEIDPDAPGGGALLVTAVTA